MSEFDRYLERLRQRADITFSPETERALRTYFQAAVARYVKAGYSRHDAELEALGELGRSEVVAAALHREYEEPPRQLIRRASSLVLNLVGGWRTLALAAAIFATFGAFIGCVQYPLYIVRVPLIVHVPADYGNGAAMRTVLTHLHYDTDLAVHVRWMPSPTLEVKSHNRAFATNEIERAAEEAARTVSALLGDLPHGSRSQVRVTPETPEVAVWRPVWPFAGAGGGLGLVAGTGIVLRRRKPRP